MTEQSRRGDGDFNDRIDSLEAATDRLSQSVVGLSTSLAIITEINERQFMLEIRTTNAENAADSSTKAAQANTDAIETAQAANRHFAIAAAVVAAVFLALLSYTRYESVSQIKDRLAASKIACQSSNQRSEIEASILDYSAKSSPAGSAQLQKSAMEIRSLKADCQHLFGPQNVPGFLNP